MIRRRRHARFLSASAAGSDTDALQTDVMRFMSIIGLCLMAVFALVQGIPVQEQGKPALVLQAARIRQEIRAQQQQLRELQAELQALKSEKDRTQQVLTDSKKHLVQLAGQTQQARELRDRLETRLENLDRQLDQGRQALADIEQDSAQQAHNPEQLSGRLLSTQEQLDHNREEIAAVKRQSQQNTDQPVPVARPVPDKQGFTLRFATDAALDRLVTAGSVSLYGMVDQQAWRLSMDAGRPVVMPVPFPGWFHEMSATTVPEHYIHGLENTVDGIARPLVVWGVQLPVATKAAIALLMQGEQTRGQQGGVLVIRSDGQVVLEK
ncbi:MAG: hypothetical protein ABFS24_00415 [Pseudomonadota bacterium]